MKKYAAIDIGTNSMRLLLAETKDGKIINREKYINTTRIGSFVDKNKNISKEGMTRNIEAFCQFVQKAKEYKAEKILAIATSAVRDAKNKEEFIQTAYQKTGINIKTISGEEEATLGYKGVIMGMKEETGGRNLCPISPFKWEKEPVPSVSCISTDSKAPAPTTIVIDIGGGSTELIVGKGSTLKKTISLNIGAVRMTERFITTDPINKEEQEEMEIAIYKILKETEHSGDGSFCVACDTKEPSPCVHVTAAGIGGTITTLAALHQKLDPYNPEKVHNYKLALKDINNLKEKLLSLTTEQIKQLKGIQPKRADIIVAGITILSIIMDNLKLNEIIVSEYDNLEGLIMT